MIRERRAIRPAKSWLVIDLVAKTENALVLFVQVSQKCRVKEQRMIPVGGHIFLAQRNVRIVIGIEDGVSWLEHRMRLPMNARAVKHEDRAGLPLHFDNLGLI